MRRDALFARRSPRRILAYPRFSAASCGARARLRLAAEPGGSAPTARRRRSQARAHARGDWPRRKRARNARRRSATSSPRATRNGEDVACDIVKTWREEDIVKMLGGKISWPWGKAVCQSKLELQRKPLALAMSESEL